MNQKIEKIIFLTGATSGIGFEFLNKIINNNYYFILPVRQWNHKKDFKNFYENNKNKIYLMEMDLGNFQSFTNKNTIQDIFDKFEKIDIMIHNAGIYTHEKKLNNNIELQWIVNYLSPAYLTIQFLDLLSKSNFSQVLFISSRMHYLAKIDFNDLNYYNSYNGQLAYANSKFAITSFCMYISDIFSNIHFYACHPGVYSTGITRDLPFIIKFFWNIAIPGPKNGAYVLKEILLNPDYNFHTKTYFNKLKIEKAHTLCYDKEIQNKLIQFLKNTTSVFL